MPELTFRVEQAEVGKSIGTPAIAVRVEIANSVPDETIHSILLRSQVQIETARRRYSIGEKSKLQELFGDPAQWNRTLKPLLWANVTNVVSAFAGKSLVDVMLPCTADFHAAVATYFQALEDGTVSLTLLFSGTIFYQSTGGTLQVAPVSWNSEARFPFPVALWQQCLEHYFPNSIWLPVRRDLYDRMRKMKAQQGLASLDELMDRMIAARSEVAV
jgi:hypothetical protein